MGLWTRPTSSSCGEPSGQQPAGPVRGSDQRRAGQEGRSLPLARATVRAIRRQSEREVSPTGFGLR
eukprot:1474377-Heterocapsa_arctica.AAC.1